jgi:hypothetical protein
VSGNQGNTEDGESRRELLDAIGPEIERREFRRQFRNFIILIAIVIAASLAAYALWRP